jgi:hypothetical protein
MERAKISRTITCANVHGNKEVGKAEKGTRKNGE